MKNEVLRLGETIEAAASARPSPQAARPAGAAAFDRTLLSLQGATSAAPAKDFAAVATEPHARAGSARESDDRDDDASLGALLPGLELPARHAGIPAKERPASTPGIATTQARGDHAQARPARAATQPDARPTPASAAATPAGDPEPPAGLAGAAAPNASNAPAAAIPTNIPAPDGIGASRTDAGARRSAATPATAGPIQPVVASQGQTAGVALAATATATAVDIAFRNPGLPAGSARPVDGLRLDQGGVRGGRGRTDPSGTGGRPAVAPGLASPEAAESQARQQFVAQLTAAQAVAPNAAVDAPAARAAVQAGAATPPPLAELVTRIAGGKADALQLQARGGATPGTEAAPAPGAAWTPGNPAVAAAPAMPASPDLAGAAGRAAWQQALVRHIGLLVAGETGEARLQVESGKLGPIDVQVRIDGDRVDVRFSIQHPITASLVQDAMPRLEKMLEQHGFSLAHASIDQGQAREQGGRDASGTAQTAPAATSREADPSGADASLQPVARSRSDNALLDDFA